MSTGLMIGNPPLSRFSRVPSWKAAIVATSHTSGSVAKGPVEGTVMFMAISVKYCGRDDFVAAGQTLPPHSCVRGALKVAQPGASSRHWLELKQRHRLGSLPRSAPNAVESVPSA